MRIKCPGCSASTINGHPAHESGCLYSFILIDRKGIEHKLYQTWFLDVWGNRIDGYEVNDRSKGPTVILPSDASDLLVFKQLKKQNILRKGLHFTSFDFDSNDGSILVSRNDEPIVDLEVL